MLRKSKNALAKLIAKRRTRFYLNASRALADAAKIPGAVVIPSIGGFWEIEIHAEEL